MRRIYLATALSIAAFSTMAQTTATPPEGSDYQVLTVKSPINGQPVHLLSCANGTTDCAYKWNDLCATGKATNTDPTGAVGGDAPAYIRDKSGNPMRMFVCKQ
jgi:hypothetical protein